MRYALLLLLLVIPTSIDAQESTESKYPEAVAIFEEPFHQPVYEQNTFKVLDIHVPALATTKFHIHAEPIHYVLFQDSYLIEQLAGGEWSTPGADELNADLTQYLGMSSADIYSAENAKVHRIRNNGQRPFRILGIINQGAGATHDANILGQNDWTGEPFENRWFKSSPIELMAQSSAEDMHIANDAIIFNPFGDNVQIEINGRSARLQDWMAIQRNMNFKLTNKDDEPARLVLVEIR
jgi:hypothetical protein